MYMNMCVYIYIYIYTHVYIHTHTPNTGTATLHNAAEHDAPLPPRSLARALRPWRLTSPWSAIGPRSLGQKTDSAGLSASLLPPSMAIAGYDAASLLPPKDKRAWQQSYTLFYTQV